VILDRYLIREVAAPFLLGLFGLTAVFLINQLVRLSDLFVGRGLTLSALGKLLEALLPPFLLITLPAACLLAGIVAFSRLSADSEFVALKSAGVSFLSLMRPVMLFSGVVAAAALAVGLGTEPWGKGKLKDVALQTLQAQAGAAITPGTFSDLFGDVVVYADEAPNGGLANLFISDERDPDRPLLVTAREGALVRTPEEGMVGLLLRSGEIYRMSASGGNATATAERPAADPSGGVFGAAGPGDSVQHVRFDEYDLKLHLKTSGGPVFGTVQEIRDEVARRRAAGEPVARMLRLWLDSTKNFTFAAACFIFGVLGPALGLTAVRSGRMGGFAAGVALIIVYYTLTTVATALVVGERIPVLAGAWLPNGVFLLATLWVLARAQRERPLLPRIPGLSR
jgi:lipopolysaccharide export system permease protein